MYLDSFKNHKRYQGGSLPFFWLKQRQHPPAIMAKRSSLTPGLHQGAP